jgi:putative endonuclease
MAINMGSRPLARHSGGTLVARQRGPCVYILASGERGTLYVGVSSDLIQRVRQHRTDAIDGFTKQHRVHMLIWFEQHETMESAIAREGDQGMETRVENRADRDAQSHWRDLYDDLI